MRVDSLLFAAILFACCNTSSASAISTTVRSLTSKREDDAARGANEETTKEERDRLTWGFEDFEEEVDAKPFAFIKNWYDKLNIKNEVDAYNMLNIDKVKSKVLRKALLDTWLRFVLKRAKTDFGKYPSTEIVKFDQIRHNNNLLRLLANVRKDESMEQLHKTVEKAIKSSWKHYTTTSESLFKKLGLDTMPTSDDSLYFDLFHLWREITNDKVAGGQTEVFEVINSYDGELGVMIRNKLRPIKDEKQFVKEFEESLLSSWAKKRIPVNSVFEWLNLAKEKDDSNFSFWIHYVLKVCRNLDSKDKEKVVELSADYSETGPLSVFCALVFFERGKALQATLKSAILDTWHEKGLNEVDVFKSFWGLEKPDKTKVSYRGFIELLGQYRHELKQMQT